MKAKEAAILVVVTAAGTGLFLGAHQKSVATMPAAGHVDQVDQVAQGPAGPAGGPVRSPDVVFERSKPVLRCVVEGSGKYHHHQAGVLYVRMYRMYHESFYVGGQHGVTSGRQITQDLGSTEIPPDQVHNFTFIMDKIKSERPAATPTPEDQAE